MYPRSSQDLKKISEDIILFVLKYDLSRSHTNFLLNILKIACLKLKNLAKSSLYLGGIQIQDLGKNLIRSYRILSI